jgi:excisionase family DNA binding protein
MKQSTYNNFDDLPLFLNAETAAALLGVSISSMYELMHEKGFPVLRVGSRLVIPKDKLRAWVEQNTGK